jgi:hypothetical protein
VREGPQSRLLASLSLVLKRSASVSAARDSPRLENKSPSVPRRKVRDKLRARGSYYPKLPVVTSVRYTSMEKMSPEKSSVPLVPAGFGINKRPCGFEHNTPTRCSSMTQPPPKPPRPGERGPMDPPGSTINYARPAYFAPSRRVTAANHQLSSRNEPIAVSSQEPVNQSGMEPRAWLMSHGFNPNGDLSEQIASHRYFWIVSSVRFYSQLPSR